MLGIRELSVNGYMNIFFRCVGCQVLLKQALLVSKLQYYCNVVLIPTFYLIGISKTVVIKCVIRINRSERRNVNMEFSYLSPFVFTKILLPLMVETARQPGTDVRIINVSGGDYCR